MRLIDRFVTVDGLLSSAAVIAAALFWDHGWSRAAETATVMALVRFGYWLYRWCCTDRQALTAEDLLALERRLEQVKAQGWANWK